MIFDINNYDEIETLTFRTHPNMRVGLTSGTFDLFHMYHLLFLQRCRRLCDFLIVGVDSNDLVIGSKGPTRPFFPEHERLLIINELKCVDAAFILSDKDQFGDAVRRLQVDLIFKNDQFKPEEVIGREDAQVVIIKDVKVFDSTTSILHAVASAMK